MTRLTALSVVALFATPALAQQGGAGNAGFVVGGIIGILLLIVIGAVVGFLASLIVKGGGSGFWGDVLFGIGGSMLAGFALPRLGFGTGQSLVGAFVAALIGAVALILIVRLIRKAAA